MQRKWQYEKGDLTKNLISGSRKERKMEPGKETIERAGKSNGEENERRMEIARKAAQTTRYRRDQYNIDELNKERYWRLLGDLIRTR